MYDAHHKGISYNIFFVLKGLVDGEEGARAQKSSAGGQLEDGWYYLLEGEGEADGPHEFREEAEQYAQMAIEADAEAQLCEDVINFAGELIKDRGFPLDKVENAFNEAVEYFKGSASLKSFRGRG